MSLKYFLLAFCLLPVFLHVLLSPIVFKSYLSFTSKPIPPKKIQVNLLCLYVHLLWDRMCFNEGFYYFSHLTLSTNTIIFHVVLKYSAAFTTSDDSEVWHKLKQTPGISVPFEDTYIEVLSSSATDVLFKLQMGTQ